MPISILQAEVASCAASYNHPGKSPEGLKFVQERSRLHNSGRGVARYQPEIRLIRGVDDSYRFFPATLRGELNGTASKSKDQKAFDLPWGGGGEGDSVR